MALTFHHPAPLLASFGMVNTASCTSKQQSLRSARSSVVAGPYMGAQREIPQILPHLHTLAQSSHNLTQ